MKNKPVNKIYLAPLKHFFKKIRNSSKSNSKTYNKFDKIKTFTNLQNIKVATILDSFSYECLKYEFNIIPIEYVGWKKQLKEQKPDLLFVESAWYGNKGLWKGKITNLGIRNDKTLVRLVEWCKKSNIPTVFWNKEDPGNFDAFIKTAKLFDYVFTTDINCISKYKRTLNHNNIYPLPFAAQPKIHNPINRNQGKLGKVAFAGTWRDLGHGKRAYYANMLLKPAFKYGLNIYDRSINSKNPELKFPDEYTPYIIGYLPYEKILDAYKKYDVFLNVNSCEDSPTMFSRRIFEILGCGTNIISSYSLGIEEMFSNIVIICNESEDVEYYLELLLENDVLRDKLSLLGQRKIFNSHTYKHRFEEILDKIYPNFKKSDVPSVSIITCTNRPNSIDNIFYNFNSQTYENKELIIVLNNNDLDLSIYKKKAKKYKNIRIFRLEQEKTLGECLNYAISESNSEYIAKFDDDDYYGPNYLVDSLNAFKYVDADVVGKLASYIYFESSNTLAIRFPSMENRYVEYITGPTMVIKKEVFNKIKFTHKNQGEDTQFLKDCSKIGLKIYAIDRFNHVYIRHSHNNENTWKFDEKEYIKKCDLITQTDDYKYFVEV